MKKITFGFLGMILLVMSALSLLTTFNNPIDSQFIWLWLLCTLVGVLLLVLATELSPERKEQIEEQERKKRQEDWRQKIGR